MISKKLLISATTAGFLLTPFALQAADPVSNIGITGSHNDLPLTAGLYYNKTNYQLKDKHDISNTKLKNDEFGVKVGLAF